MAARAPATTQLSSLTLLPAILALQIAKRIGLGKPVVRLALKRMLSRRTRERAFAGYTPTASDVFVATFGKSGTNWMMQIALQIAHRGAAEFEHIHDLVPWPDAPGGRIVPLSDRGPQRRSPTGLRVIKTHVEAEFVPYDTEATYLTVLRDPKEVVVSSYYFLGGVLGVLDRVSFDDWFALCTEPDALTTAWAAHTASFWEWRDRPNVLVLSYRQLENDLVDSIRRVASTMGVSLTAAEFDAVARRASFSYMKTHESQFAPPLLPLMRTDDRPAMVRLGRSGASDELLTRAQQLEIDRACGAELARLGSDYPYASTFALDGAG